MRAKSVLWMSILNAENVSFIVRQKQVFLELASDLEWAWEITSWLETATSLCFTNVDVVFIKLLTLKRW